jgi:hypothetical protein
MGIRNDANNLIFLVYRDRRRETETPNYQLCANYILASSAYWQSSG